VKPEESKDTEPAKDTPPLEVNEQILLKLKAPLTDGPGIAAHLISIPECGLIVPPGLSKQVKAAGEKEQKVREALLAAYGEEKQLSPEAVKEAVQVNFSRPVLERRAGTGRRGGAKAAGGERADEPLEVGATVLLSRKNDAVGGAEFRLIPVREPGTISLPGLPKTINVAGKKEQDVRAAILAAYAEEKSLSPEAVKEAVEVTFDRRTNTLIFVLKKPVSEGNGMMRAMQVRESGTVALPGLSRTVKVAGEKEQDVRAAILAAYAEEKGLSPEAVKEAVEVTFDRDTRLASSARAEPPRRRGQNAPLPPTPAPPAADPAPSGLPPVGPGAAAPMPPQALPPSAFSGGPVAPGSLPPPTPVPAPGAAAPVAPPPVPSPYPPMPGVFPSATTPPTGMSAAFPQPGMAPGYGAGGMPQVVPQPVAPPAFPAGPMVGSAGRSRMDAERDALLARKLPEVNFDQASISEVINFLRDASGSNLVVDWRALESAGVKQNTNVTLQLRNVSFRKALETALFLASGDQDLLDYQADDGVILVSTAGKLRRAQTEGVRAVAPASTAAPRIAPTGQPAQAMSDYVPRGGGAFNPFSPPNAANRQAGGTSSDATRTGSVPRDATTRPAGTPAPAERRRGSGSRGGSSGSGRAPGPVNDGEPAAESPSPEPGKQ
jgi:hypothetical protein